MAEKPESAAYHPESIIKPPPIYDWPPRPLAVLKYLTWDMLFPWGYLYIAMAFVSWVWLMPSMETMATLSLDWMALVWLRNAFFLTLVAGGLHWWLYMRKSQDREMKFDGRWQAVGDDRFLWGDQVKDNMFWSLVSGVTIWTVYECITFWFYASGRLPFMTISEHPIYFIFTLYLVFFWGYGHFYLGHRFLHWKPMFNLAHELHHRNVNIGPWSGLSMHPVEHVIYLSVFVTWWFVPVHPVVVLVTGYFMGIGPAPSHSGFDFVKTGRGRISAGDLFHQLHHKYFHVNYGNTPAPLDKVFDSWHDGSDAGKAVVKRRMRKIPA